MFRSLALRTKLFMVVGVPLLVLGAVVAFAFVEAKNLADDAAQQVEEVEHTLVIEQLAATLRTELAATLDANGTAESLEVARSATDSVWTDVFGFLSEADRADLDLKQSELLRLREGFGDDPVTTQNLLSLEILGEAPEPPQILGATQAFETLITETAQLDRLQGDVFTDGQIALDIVLLKNLALWEGALVAERNAFQLYLQPGVPAAVAQEGLLGPNAAAAQAQEQFNNLTLAGRQAIADRLAGNPAVLTLDRARATNRSGSTEARSSLEMSSATAGADELLAAIAGEQSVLRQNVVASANQIAADARLLQRNMLLGGLGLFLVISLITLLLARSITRPLKSLSRRSLEIASEDLPAAVALFRTHGASAEVPQIEPLVSASKDDLGDLVGAFNRLHTTAIELASKQGQPRSVAASVYVNLGRRNEKMLSRLLHEVDELKRDELAGGRLSRLYSVDKMVTRMRRNAESLLVLAGTRTPRDWEEPADISDVIRAAMSEVEGIERVDVQVEDPLLIDGDAVADVVHLLAELIENALTFSPSTTRVRVGLRLNSTESLLFVADEGLGLQGDALVAANNRIGAAGRNQETPSEKLGLYAVGRLAARHGLTAGLVEETIGGGIVARVELGPVTLRKKRSGAPKTSSDARAVVVTSAKSHGTMPIEPVLPDNDHLAPAASDLVASSDALTSAAEPADQAMADAALEPTELAVPVLVPKSLRAPERREQGTGAMPSMPNAVPASAEVESFDTSSAPGVPDDLGAPVSLGRRSSEPNLHDEHNEDEMEQPLMAVAADQFAAEFAAIGIVEAASAEVVPFDASLSHRHDPLQSIAPLQHENSAPSRQESVVQSISDVVQPTVPMMWNHRTDPADPETLDRADPETLDQPDLETLDRADPETLDRADLERLDRADPETLDLPSSVASGSIDVVEPASQEVFDAQALETAVTGFQRGVKPFDQAAFPDEDEDESPIYESENSWGSLTSLWSDAPEGGQVATPKRA